MSRYTFTGKDPLHRVIVGWDPTPGLRNEPGTLYAQVEDLAVLADLDEDEEEEYQQIGGQLPSNEEEESAIGDTLEEGLLLWVGQGLDDIISDVQGLVKALAPYGSIPLPIQVDLLRDLDRDWPRPWQIVGAALAAICQQAPTSTLGAEPEEGTSYYLLLNQDGWQLREWETLGGGDYERAIAEMIYTTESDRRQFRYTEPLASYVSDPSIIFRVHEQGASLGLPVFTAFARGVMLSGPVVIANEASGLAPSQVSRVKQEVFFVDETIRAPLSNLWYHVWSTLGSRSGR